MERKAYLYCPKCKEETLHDSLNVADKTERVLARVFTLGIMSGQVLDYFCVRCQKRNYRWERAYNRFTWARKGTGILVDEGIYGSYEA